MKKIIKYVLEVVDSQKIDIPLPAIILSVTEQGIHVALYAIVDDDKDVPTESVEILIKGTGHHIKDDIDRYTFIGTAKLFNSNLESHVFYRRVGILAGKTINIAEKRELAIV